MLRTLLIGLVALPLTVAATVGYGSGPIMPRYKVEVTSDVVRLGDLFSNVGDKAEIVVEVAPKPGVAVTFQPSQLAAIARHHKLEWQPSTYNDKVVVERASSVVPKEIVEAALRHALARRGLVGDIEFDLPVRAAKMMVAEGRKATVGAEIQHFDPNSRAFVAELWAPADDPKAERLRISAQAFQMVDVPVANRRVLPKETIAKEDIDWVRMRNTAALSNILWTLDDLVGNSPRQPLTAGLPIRPHQVGPNHIVGRGETVTMIVRTPLMTLTAQGRALEDGAKGNTIRVLNVKSGRTVEGRVSGPNEVTLQSLQRIASR
jgi:flagella basal body P-ring formation protein FlgA